MRLQGVATPAPPMSRRDRERAQESHRPIDLDTNNSDEASMSAHAKQVKGANLMEVRYGKACFGQQRFDLSVEWNRFDTQFRCLPMCSSREHLD